MVDAYRKALRRAGKRPNTQRAYLRHVVRFVDSVGDLEPVEPEHACAYCEALTGAHRTRRQAISALKNFGAWMVDETHWAENPFEGIQSPREPRQPDPPPAWAEVEESWAALRRDGRWQVDFCAVALLMEALSPEQLRSLEWSDVDFATGMFRIPATSSRQQRSFELRTRTVSALRTWQGIAEGAAIWPFGARELRRAVMARLGWSPKAIQMSAVHHFAVEVCEGHWTEANKRLGYADDSSLMRACGRFS